MKKTLLSIFAISLLLSGCASNDNSSCCWTAEGAVIGAVAGALVGLEAGDEDTESVLIGAGSGALLGGTVGYYMDRQCDDLRDDLGNSGLDVRKDGDDIVLNMPANITFDFNSSEIKPSVYKILSDAADTIDDYDNTSVKVSGHTDATGDVAYNLDLSKRRAISVADFLVRHGVDRSRVSTAGYGEAKPIATNDTAMGRAQNRRVEIRLSTK